jgi:hypothetical protein
MASALAVRAFWQALLPWGWTGPVDIITRKEAKARVDPLLYGRALQAWACSGALNEWRDVRGLPQSDERQ